MNPKTGILFLFFNLIITSCLGQDYLGRSKEDVILEIQNYLDSTYTISLTESKVFFHSNNGFSDGDSLSKLKVNIKGYEQIEMEYYFGDTNGFCDSIRIQYSCNHCMDKHISELLSDRKRKWKKITTNKTPSLLTIVSIPSEKLLFSNMQRIDVFEFIKIDLIEEIRE